MVPRENEPQAQDISNRLSAQVNSCLSLSPSTRLFYPGARRSQARNVLFSFNLRTQPLTQAGG